MRVLDIDPGITRRGVGVVDIDVPRVASLVHVTIIRNEPNLVTQFRLLKISEGIAATVIRFSLEIVALERPFAKKNHQSVTTTIQAVGAAIIEIGRAGLSVALHIPSEVKAVVSGSGTTTEMQMEAMIARILRFDKPPRPADAADALAMAITRVWRGTGISGSGTGGDVSVSLSGGVKTQVGTKLTTARRIRAQTEAQSRRSGTVCRHSHQQSLLGLQWLLL